MIIVPMAFAITNNNYIAGSGDGIVTVQGQPASRPIYLLDAVTLAVVQIASSYKNGRYIFMCLEPETAYMVIVRDYKKEYEPFVWDYVIPATELNIDKLREII